MKHIACAAALSLAGAGIAAADETPMLMDEATVTKHVQISSNPDRLVVPLLLITLILVVLD